MLGLVIVDDETGVNHAGDPAEKGEKQTEDETQEAAGHEDGNRWEDDAKKVAERFHESEARDQISDVSRNSV